MVKMAHTFGQYVVRGKRWKLEKFKKSMWSNLRTPCEIKDDKCYFDVKNTYEFGIMETLCEVLKLKYYKT